LGTTIKIPAPLSANHCLDNFDCGNSLLNEWLSRYSLVNQQSHAARTFVVSDHSRVIGFYSLAVGSVQFEDAPARAKKGPARHPIPIMILARLAVDKSYQECGIGAGLLKDALLRTILVSEHAGVRAVFVNSKNEGARSFFRRYGFEPSLVDPLWLMLPGKDIKKSLGS
jgi:GNAT superfamily N-acetyltransferase